MSSGLAGTVLALASPLLVFIAAVLGVYFTTKRDNRKEKLDEVKFLVQEIKEQKKDAQIELERIKAELKISQTKEAKCLENLQFLREILVSVRGHKDDRRFGEGHQDS